MRKYRVHLDNTDLEDVLKVEYWAEDTMHVREQFLDYLDDFIEVSEPLDDPEDYL